MPLILFAAQNLLLIFKIRYLCVVPYYSVILLFYFLQISHNVPCGTLLCSYCARFALEGFMTLFWYVVSRLTHDSGYIKACFSSLIFLSLLIKKLHSTHCPFRYDETLFHLLCAMKRINASRKLFNYKSLLLFLCRRRVFC